MSHFARTSTEICDKYPVANVAVIMERLQKLTEGKKDDFMKPDTPQTTDYQSLHSLLMEMTGGQISDHEVATVARNYLRRGDETVSSENHISMTQEHQPMSGLQSCSITPCCESLFRPLPENSVNDLFHQRSII